MTTAALPTRMPRPRTTPVAGSIGWMAFLHAPHIPYTAFEHD